MGKKKRKEHKKGVCRKCNKPFYIHDHHVLPKSIFGEDGETVALCPNCHTHYHEYMNDKIKNAENQNEVLKVWKRWFNKIKIEVVVIALIALIVSVAYLS